jgi:DNA-binding XRE family transcriptional regulator
VIGSARGKTEAPAALAALLDVRRVRQELGLSQAELAAVLGVSPRTIQSCEQGWRKPSCSLEKMLVLLVMADRHGSRFGSLACWKTKRCAPARRAQCLIYQSRQGHLCWFLTGNVCAGRRLRNWDDKKTVCGTCDFFHLLLGKPRAEGKARVGG